MAFTFKTDFTQTTACDVIRVWDTTGIYGYNNNTTGWNGPLSTSFSPISYTITVTYPDGSTSTEEIDDGSEVIGFQYGSIFKEITLDSTDSGIYTVTVEVTYIDYDADPGGEITDTATATVTRYIMCEYECIVNQLWDEATGTIGSCDSCAKEKLQLAAEADMYLKAAKFAANCNMFNKTAQILEKIDNLNEFKNCTNCN